MYINIFFKVQFSIIHEHKIKFTKKIHDTHTHTCLYIYICNIWTPLKYMKNLRKQSKLDIFSRQPWQEGNFMCPFERQGDLRFVSYVTHMCNT